MKSTINGSLREIPDCQIVVPEAGAFGGDGIIKLNNLPDISDNKSAVYNGEAIIGRSFPLYTYSHSGERNISMQVHFFIINPGDGARNLYYLRMLQSAVYPRSGDSVGTPYLPPPICRIKCGPLLDNDELCVILQSYSVKFPTEVAWEESTYCPFRFDVDLSWQVVYPSDSLPFQEDIIKAAREARIFQSTR
jgi:hypothetical protein